MHTSRTRLLDFADYIGQSGAAVFIMDAQVGEAVTDHAHNFTELVIVTHGKGRHEEGGETWPLARGDVFAVPVGRSHSYHDVHDLQLVNILADLRKLSEPMAPLTTTPGFQALFSVEPAARARTGRTCRLKLTNTQLAHARALMSAMGEEQRKAAPGWQTLMSGLFLELLTWLVRCYNEASSRKPRSLLRISSLLAHMEAHCEEPVTLASLAARAGMSPRTLSRTFRSLLDRAPVEYLLELRIERACQLMRDRPDLNMTEVAMQTGFNDGAYFSRRFARHTGLPPLRWRKQQSAGNSSGRGQTRTSLPRDA